MIDLRRVKTADKKKSKNARGKRMRWMKLVSRESSRGGTAWSCDRGKKRKVYLRQLYRHDTTRHLTVPSRSGSASHEEVEYRGSSSSSCCCGSWPWFYVDRPAESQSSTLLATRELNGGNERKERNTKIEKKKKHERMCNDNAAVRKSISPTFRLSFTIRSHADEPTKWRMSPSPLSLLSVRCNFRLRNFRSRDSSQTANSCKVDIKAVYMIAIVFHLSDWLSNKFFSKQNRLGNIQTRILLKLESEIWKKSTNHAIDSKDVTHRCIH